MARAYDSAIDHGAIAGPQARQTTLRDQAHQLRLDEKRRIGRRAAAALVQTSDTIAASTRPPACSPSAPRIDIADCHQRLRRGGRAGIKRGSDRDAGRRVAAQDMTFYGGYTPWMRWLRCTWTACSPGRWTVRPGARHHRTTSRRRYSTGRWWGRAHGGCHHRQARGSAGLPAPHPADLRARHPDHRHRRSGTSAKPAGTGVPVCLLAWTATWHDAVEGQTMRATLSW